MKGINNMFTKRILIFGGILILTFSNKPFAEEEIKSPIVKNALRIYEKGKKTAELAYQKEMVKLKKNFIRELDKAFNRAMAKKNLDLANKINELKKKTKAQKKNNPTLIQKKENPKTQNEKSKSLKKFLTSNDWKIYRKNRSSAITLKFKYDGTIVNKKTNNRYSNWKTWKLDEEILIITKKETTNTHAITGMGSATYKKIPIHMGKGEKKIFFFLD